ncbi:hydrogenase-2 small chain [Escherichia coli]|uniref:Hydrogenase-2 small chain n=1 Tax=Escherichia coli TaxID=562 RepID=A0A377DLK9_ECOLX|nr:hydrogenase-2 small chain [Escherichia coli]
MLAVCGRWRLVTRAMAVTKKVSASIKGIHQLANVENQTPRSQKPDVNAKEGGNVSAGAIGLLGGVVGLVAGVSVMAVRELGRQQKKDNADSRGE